MKVEYFVHLYVKVAIEASSKEEANAKVLADWTDQSVPVKGVYGQVTGIYDMDELDDNGSEIIFEI